MCSYKVHIISKIPYIVRDQTIDVNIEYICLLLSIHNNQNNSSVLNKLNHLNKARTVRSFSLKQIYSLRKSVLHGEEYNSPLLETGAHIREAIDQLTFGSALLPKALDLAPLQGAHSDIIWLLHEHCENMATTLTLYNI